jgi:hypothetical protein
VANVVTILAIDGGGIRGLIPAVVLERIETETKKPISDLFDLIIGTSTGGIIGLGLTVPNEGTRPRYQASEIVNLYVTKGETIFSRSVGSRFGSLWGGIGSVYPADRIEEVLQQYFAETRLKDARTEVVVTSYDIEKRHPYFLKSFHARRQPVERDCYMWQAARATSAAPWYFPPYKLDRESAPDDYLTLVDGGVFVNNPALAGYTEALALTHQRPDVDYLVVSLGTGDMTRRFPYEDAEGWGVRGWLERILDIVFDGTSSAIDHQMRLLLPELEGHSRYFRFQCPLTHASDEMDLATKDNIKALRDQAWNLMRKEEARLQQLCARLVEFAERKNGRGWGMLGEAANSGNDQRDAVS